jgi:hypothetical protein
MIPVGPGPTPPPQDEAETWPHWRDLLDGPKPQADRLREHTEESALGERLSGNDPISLGGGASPLGEAIRRLRNGSSSRGFVPWPTSDRRAGDEWPAEDKSPSESAKATG